MTARRFRNDGPTTVVAPTLGVAIAPGETVELDLPDSQPAPDVLTEIGGTPTKVAEQQVAEAHAAIDDAHSAVADAEQKVADAVKTVEGDEAKPEKS
jgi:hypothetical protein